MNLDGILSDGRTMVAGLMEDACRITRPATTPPVFDDSTGQYLPLEPIELYVGPCRVKAVDNVTRDVEAGDRVVSLRRQEVAIPFAAPTPVLQGDHVTITAVSSYGDPWLVGRVFSVVAVVYSSTATARKLTVEEAQA